MMTNKKRELLVFISVAAIIAISGCTQQQQEIKEIILPWHGDTIYEFSYDIRESLPVKTNNATAIKDYVNGVDRINIVYNGSGDIPTFKVVSINIISKLQAYSAYKGVPMGFRFYYYAGGQWYESNVNGTSERIEQPKVSGATIWLNGPDTGADDTSVILHKGIIYLQGTSPKNLVLAGDKLVLIVFGIESVDDAVRLRDEAIRQKETIV